MLNKYNKYEEFLEKTLLEHAENHALRRLHILPNGVDFCSNDYLGLSKISAHIPETMHGATGSRLISGNHAEMEETEAFLADFYRADAALLFNSGYDANIGFWAAVPQRGDIILYDKLIHASIRDGLRLSLDRKSVV